jgi:hypothetical protein
MYKTPYNNLANAKVMEDIEKLSDEIAEEKKKPNADRHKILRLEEQKLIQGLFSNELGSSYGKYRSPW